MRGLLALIFVVALTLVAHGQTCVNGVCSLEQRPTLAPSLPPLAPAMRSVLESHSIRRVAVAPVRYANQRVVQPTLRYGSNAVRVFRYNRSF